MYEELKNKKERETIEERENPGNKNKGKLVSFYGIPTPAVIYAKYNIYIGRISSLFQISFECNRHFLSTYFLVDLPYCRIDFIVFDGN